MDKIQELEDLIKELTIELEDKKAKKKLRHKPILKFWVVEGDGRVKEVHHDGESSTLFDHDAYQYFNCYKTEELAEKAAVMMKRSNAIIMACLLVDPDFMPDYKTIGKHYSFVHSVGHFGNNPRWYYHIDDNQKNYGPSVSSLKKFNEASALLSEWGVE